MKESSLGIIIGILNIILLVVCIVLFLGKDRSSPVITLGECNYVYEEDLPETILLQEVTAYDEEDGDVTASVVVEKVVTDRAKGCAVITYGACDASGNVAKATRTLAMPVLTRIQFPGAGEAGSVEVVETVTNQQEEIEDGEVAEENESVEVVAEEETEETTEDTTGETAEETQEENGTQEEALEENETEEAETTENEGEGTTTGGNVTVVGSNRRN